MITPLWSSIHGCSPKRIGGGAPGEPITASIATSHLCPRLVLESGDPACGRSFTVKRVKWKIVAVGASFTAANSAHLFICSDASIYSTFLVLRYTQPSA